MQFLGTSKRVICMFLVFALLLVSNTVAFAQYSRDEFNGKLDLSDSVLYDNPDLAIRLTLEARDIAASNDDHWGVAIGLANLGYISYEVGDYRASLLNYMKAYDALQKADTTDLSNEIIILNELSRIQSEFNNHDESIKYGEIAWRLAKNHVTKNRKYAEENDQLRWLVDIPYYMALEYQAKGAHQTAGNILFDLWEQAENKKDILAYAQVLNELGIIKMNNGEYSAAQEYFGIVVSSPEVDDWDKATAYHNLAGTYMNQGNYDKAESYFLIALDINYDLEDPLSQFITLLDFGELEFKRENTEQAIEYWENALTTFDEIETNPELYSIYNWLQLAYMDVDVEKAKEYNLKYTRLNDFYVKNQTEQRELEAQNRELLSALIDQQRQDRIDAEQKKRFLQQFWPVLLGVLLLVLFSFVMGVRYYMALRTNRLLSRKQLLAQQLAKN